MAETSDAPARPYDTGEYICRPFLKFIPKSVSPNTITYFNQICMWLMIFFSFTWHWYPEHLQPAALFLAAFLNFLCMMLDCLDGMHARATNQCSKLGEVLDHWFDAINTPLVSAGCSYALGPDAWICTLAQVLNISIYSAQIIVFYHTKKFVGTSGVEGQIGVSLCILIRGVTLLFPGNPEIQHQISNVLVSIGVIAIIYLISSFIRLFDKSMWLRQLEYWGILAFISYFYMDGALGTRAYLIISSVISFRITGTYVLHSICNLEYSGRDYVIYAYMAVFYWFHYCCDPIPLSLLFSKIGNGEYFDAYTLQDLLPFIFTFFMMKRNFQTLADMKPTILAIDAQNKKKK